VLGVSRQGFTGRRGLLLAPGHLTQKSKALSISESFISNAFSWTNFILDHLPNLWEDFVRESLWMLHVRAAMRAIFDRLMLISNATVLCCIDDVMSNAMHGYIDQ